MMEWFYIAGWILIPTGIALILDSAYNKRHTNKCQGGTCTKDSHKQYTIYCEKHYAQIMRDAEW